MDEQRAEFEAWLVSRWAGDRGGLTRNEAGEYWMPQVQFAWSAYQAATQRQQERTSQSRTGYMCLTDFQHELGEASGGISVYADEDDLKKHRNCWKGCGILKVEVVAAIAAGKGTT